MPPTEAGYRQLRAVCTGRAREIVDLCTAHGQGLMLVEYLQQLVFAQPQAANARQLRDQTGANLYAHIVASLSDAVRLTLARRLEIAEKKYADAKMLGDTVQDAEAFLSKWRQARRLMHKEGLLAFNPAEERQRMLQGGLAPQYADYILRPAVAQNARELNQFFTEPYFQLGLLLH